MKTQIASATALIKSPAKSVYDIIADYHVGHPSINPKQYFGGIKVLEGGVGAGTEIEFEMTVGGTRRTYRAQVQETEPGRVLLETNYDVTKPNLKNATTFAVDPVNGGKHAQVTIRSEIQVSNWLEGLYVNLFLRGVYKQELKLLAQVAAKNVKVDLNLRNTF